MKPYALFLLTVFAFCLMTLPAAAARSSLADVLQRRDEACATIQDLATQIVTVRDQGVSATTVVDFTLPFFANNDPAIRPVSEAIVREMVARLYEHPRPGVARARQATHQICMRHMTQLMNNFLRY